MMYAVETETDVWIVEAHDHMDAWSQVCGLTNTSVESPRALCRRIGVVPRAVRVMKRHRNSIAAVFL
jgi:hypothetical protein